MWCADPGHFPAIFLQIFGAGGGVTGLQMVLMDSEIRDAVLVVAATMAWRWQLGCRMAAEAAVFDAFAVDD